jgi:hypothetical protein
MPGQAKKINPGRTFRLFYSEGEKMNFEQAKYKYNCHARDVLGLVGELDIPDPAKSNPLTQVINLKECSLYVLRNQNGRTIATIDIKRGRVL